MKAEPPVDKLEQFLRNLPTLNPDLICPALLDSLEDGSPWIARAKALCVIEKTLQATMEPNPYADFFHACASEIEPLTSHSRAAIRDPARRIWKELGFELHYDNADTSVASGTSSYAPQVTAASVATTTTINAVPAPEADLLDFGGDDVEPVPPTVPPPTAPAPSIVFTPSQEDIVPPTTTHVPQLQSPSSSLFGGLTVQHPQQESAPTYPPQADPVFPTSESNDTKLIFGGNTPKNEAAA